jgi:hypothetical protein
MVTVECRGMDPAAAEVLASALRALLGGLQGRDGDLAPAAALRLVVADDFAAALAEEGSGPGLGKSQVRPVPPRGVEGAGGAEAVVQALHRPGEVALVVDGGRVAAALAGPPEEVARLAHLLHRELWRIQAVERRQARPVAPADDFERHLQPVVEALWVEYVSTRRAVWSLPADADLLLPHLAELLEALPPAVAGDITLALAEGRLDELFARTLGRVTHLMQVAGHVQGYLAGLGRSLESISPELAERLQASFLGPRWARLARLLEALYGSDGQWDGEFLHNALRPEVLAVFAALGLDLRPTEDGGVWLEPRPALH